MPGKSVGYLRILVRLAELENQFQLVKPAKEGSLFPQLSFPNNASILRSAPAG